MIKRIIDIYWRYCKSPISYARHKGVEIGKNCLITTRCWSAEPYLIKIGNNVQITNDVRFQTHGGGHVARSKYSTFDVFGKIVIEDGVYIGAASQIMPGVTIGTGALVAAGSIVTKSVAPHTVVGGNPAKYLCSVDEYIEHNMQYDVGTFGCSAAEKRKFCLMYRNISL